MQIDIESDTETREKRVLNLELLKKLPEGAEATAVLVGAVEFLQHPTIAFVRLAEGVIMENVVEVRNITVDYYKIIKLLYIFLFFY